MTWVQKVEVRSASVAVTPVRALYHWRSWSMNDTTADEVLSRR